MKTLFLLLSMVSCLTLANIPPKIQLAKNFDQQAINIKHFWISEKLDGIRGYWTGKALLTRQGNLIHAPQWFTKNWPNIPLDGELWLARNQFEATLSCVSKVHIDEQCWQAVSFMIFDLPSNPNKFGQRLKKMQHLVSTTPSPQLKMIKQVKLNSLAEMYQLLDHVTEQHGEGLMLHHENAIYQSGRSADLLKVKKRHDAEAKVLAYIPGKGKFMGMLGSIKVETPEGIIFHIGSGFSDAERKKPPAVGTYITYQYLSKTKNGVPRFASFLRVRDDN